MKLVVSCLASIPMLRALAITLSVEVDSFGSSNDTVSSLGNA